MQQITVQPQRMATKLLRERIETALDTLLPYFKITAEELRRFNKPGIRRVLQPDEHPDHSRTSPGYSHIGNFFYFPLRDPGLLTHIFSEVTINHEVSHDIHGSINPEMIRGQEIRVRTGKWPLGYHALSEVVADYVNIILELYTPEEQMFRAFRESKEIYDKYGPEFLPRLSRMSLQEAIEEGVVDIQASAES